MTPTLSRPIELELFDALRPETRQWVRIGSQVVRNLELAQQAMKIPAECLHCYLHPARPEIDEFVRKPYTPAQLSQFLELINSLHPDKPRMLGRWVNAYAAWILAPDKQPEPSQTSVKRGSGVATPKKLTAYLSAEAFLSTHALRLPPKMHLYTGLEIQRKIASAPEPHAAQLRRLWGGGVVEPPEAILEALRWWVTKT